MSVDRRRRFELPNIQDLSKDQDAALALPLRGQHLVIGGPGTGKSVVALLRVRRLVDESEDYRFLAYNRLLDQSSRHLFGESLKAFTLETWFRRMWKYILKFPVPLMPPERPGAFRPIDWDSVTNCLLERDEIGIDRRLPLLVIDEGQDMPPSFYNALVNIGFEDFYVVADQNQQIRPDTCSSRQDIEAALGIDSTQTLELVANYRNTRPIALLAQHFYPDDPASPRPHLPPLVPGVSTPELWRYGNQGGRNLVNIAELILQMADRNPRKLIGVICPNNPVRQKFFDALHRADPALDNGRPPISTFVSRQQNELEFGQGGVMVINAQSCKGLEFEIAILADIDAHQPRHDQDALRKRFYVMAARAREQVILLRTGHPVPAIEELLPQDPAILLRK